MNIIAEHKSKEGEFYSLEETLDGYRIHDTNWRGRKNVRFFSTKDAALEVWNNILEVCEPAERNHHE